MAFSLITENEATDLVNRLSSLLKASPGLAAKVIATRLTPEDVASFETLIGMAKMELKENGK